MYERFFNLSAEPFRLSPDHRFCYRHDRFAKAKAYMAYAFMRSEGFVLVTGGPGTGKTTLVGDLVESLTDENAAVANLVSTQLAADDLLRMVAYAYGVDASDTAKAVVLQHLTDFLTNLHKKGRRALLIVDEAQALNEQAMEELRLLTNLQRDGGPLLQIFLLGQPELRELIHAPGMEQVHQRIVAAAHLEPLDELETRTYVEHRLRIVGWVNDPQISMAVFPVIHRFSEGVPRRINLICSRLFLHCAVQQRHQISLSDARNVVSELQDEQLSTKNLLHDEMFHAEDSFEQPAVREPQARKTADKPVKTSGSQSGNETEADSPNEANIPPVREVKSEPKAPENGEDPGVRPEIAQALVESSNSVEKPSGGGPRKARKSKSVQLAAPEEASQTVEKVKSTDDIHPQLKPPTRKSWVGKLFSGGR